MGYLRTPAISRRIRALAHAHTVLAQGLKVIPRSLIEALDTVHGTGRSRLGLSRWSPFGALVCAPLAVRHSLREVVYALASPAHALGPIGVRPPQHSPLADANAQRPMVLDQVRFATRYARWRAMAPRPRVRFKNPRLSLGSTPISLGVSLFPGAMFHTTKGAMQVHPRLDQAGHILAVVAVTAGKRRDLAVARGLHLPVGRMVARD